MVLCPGAVTVVEDVVSPVDQPVAVSFTPPAICGVATESVCRLPVVHVTDLGVTEATLSMLTVMPGGLLVIVCTTSEPAGGALCVTTNAASTALAASGGAANARWLLSASNETFCGRVLVLMRISPVRAWPVLLAPTE